MDFSFCGVSLAKYGLHYAPKPKDIFVWGDTYDNHTVEVDGHHGGYWFGSTVKPKVFELECYFEGITSLDIKKIQSLFARGRTGDLVFSDRPFMTYTATVTKFDKPQIYGRNNGLLTIELTAFYPFARMDRNSVASYREYGEEFESILLNTTGILKENNTPPTIIDTSTPLTAATSFLLYNCGDEIADVAISIAGDVGAGISIYNSATKQTCLVRGLRKENTTHVSKWLEADSLSGKVYLTDGTTSALSFLFHDRGFIQLKGSAPIYRNIQVSYEGDLVASNKMFSKDMEGQYINLGGSWRKITSFINYSTIRIDYTFGQPGTQTTEIVTMNYVTVVPTTTMALTKLEFRYSPTFK